MNIPATTFLLSDAATILDRHNVRRTKGVPTVSLLIGPVGIGGKTWRRWSAGMRWSVVVANGNRFPHAEWINSIAKQMDLPVAAVRILAQRAERDPDEFLAAWQAKTPADCQRFWNTLAPEEDDDLLHGIAMLAVGQRSPVTVAVSLIDLGERVVPVIARLAPSTMRPSILFVAGSAEDFSSVGHAAVTWAMRVPTLSIALAVPEEIWDHYLVTAPESRTKALLREGEIAVPVIHPTAVKQTLTEAGAVESAAAVIAANGVDGTLLESAVSAIRGTAFPPMTQAEDDRARSAAERFLFEFLESLPETAGRFELNANLDFLFGPRPAEVDLLCRSPRIAVEVDGYFHFLEPEAYRRDRTKDWELQRRGFLVLRFLAEDVIPQLDIIRDRILDAIALTSLGVQP
jgi:hypothetical protein